MAVFSGGAACLCFARAFELRLMPGLNIHRINPRENSMLRLCLCVLFLFVGCSGTGPTVGLNSTRDREIAVEPQFAMAKIFDDLMQNRLNEDEQAQLDTNCRTTPQASVFCFSVLNRARLIEKTKEVEKESAPVRYTGRIYRPHFDSKNKLLNWAELRSAPVQGLLRGMPKGQKSKINALKLAALRESECPNSVAIAIAAVVEDQLPNKVSFDEVGRLYEKGGGCIGDSPADQEQILTRSGLFYFAKKDYELARNVLAKSSAIAGTFTGRALYWLYRAQTELKDTAGATKSLDTLQSKYPFSFHSLVAQTAAGRDPGELLAKAPSPSFKRSSQAPEVNQLLEQVEILHRLGFDLSASTVLDWAVAQSRGIEPEVILYMAELKKEQGDYKSKIMILSGILYQNPQLISRTTMELYFPKVLFPVFEKQSATIDPYFLLAVARRESAFDPKAVSSANARGLLQVLPTTGRRLKRRPNLFDPETNVAVGAQYIVELLKRTEGHIHFALAAYNAGPGKLNGWTKSYPTQDPILFIDLIPFRETREYVGSVLRNYYWYRRIHQSNLPIPPGKILELAIAEKQ
jgi:soluble lytic murein transglycosylase